MPTHHRVALGPGGGVVAAGAEADVAAPPLGGTEGGAAAATTTANAPVIRFAVLLLSAQAGQHAQLLFLNISGFVMTT